MGFRVWGWGLGVWASDYRVWDLGIWGLLASIYRAKSVRNLFSSRVNGSSKLSDPGMFLQLVILLMIQILLYLKDPKRWESW